MEMQWNKSISYLDKRIKCKANILIIVYKVLSIFFFTKYVINIGSLCRWNYKINNIIMYKIPKRLREILNLKKLSIKWKNIPQQL